MRIAPDQLQAIVDHAAGTPGEEVCGVVGVRDGVATSVHPLTNIHASRFRFEPDPRELIRAYNAIEDGGGELGAIYHSHTHSAPEPSQTDIRFAAGWPGVLWIIVGLAGDEPEVRTWRIDTEPVEVALEVGG
jgi:[CysO sulfur-carrier protein]-S-L-cysteine hydrolase